MANISTQKSTFTNLKANGVNPVYTTPNIVSNSQEEIETVDFNQGLEITGATNNIENGKNSRLKFDALNGAINNIENSILKKELKLKLKNSLINDEFNDEIEFEILSVALKEKCNYKEDNAYTRLYDSIIKSYKQGNKEIALINLEALAKLNNRIIFALEHDRAYISYEGNGIFKYTLKENVNSSTTAYHEFGHIIHSMLYDSKVPSNIDEIIENSKNNANENSEKLYEFSKEYETEYQRLQKKGEQAYNKEIENKYGSISNYKNELYKDIEKNIENGQIQKYIKNRNLSERTIEILELQLKRIKNASSSEEKELFETILTKRIVESIINSEKKYVIEQYKRSSYIGAVSDIISAIYQKNSTIEVDGKIIVLPFSHDEEYWTKDDNYQSTYNEIVANVNQLKMSGYTEELEKLREIFGNELFDTVDTMYEEIQK